MIEDDLTFRNLIAEARDPLSALSLDLASRGYSAQLVARLLIQTGFAIIHEHYGRGDVKKVCAHELYMFDKTWNILN